MSEVTRGEIQDIIDQNAASDPDYRQALLNRPKEILGRQLGRELPDWLNVKVVEEDSDTIYVVVPHVAEEGAELSDSDLEQLAGGKEDENKNTYTCNDARGVATRVEIETDVGFM